MNHIVNYIASIVATLSCVYGACAAPPANYDIDRVINAIRVVETGGEKNPSEAVGDAGKSIGPFQISRAYWRDAVEYDPDIGGTYTDCKDEAYARQIIRAYLCRYVKTWDDETVARTHNGGGSILKKKKDSKAWKNTTKYWQKVQKHLD
jgi:hypothetical protein